LFCFPFTSEAEMLIRKLLKVFYDYLYHSFAWTYDLVAALVSIGRWRVWGLTVLPVICGPQVLEIGFGPGYLQLELNRRGFRVYGLDESRQMVRRTQGLLRRNRCEPALVRGYAQALPYRAGSFDTVAAIFPSEYISDSATLAEIRRVLTPSGRLVVVPAAWIGGKSPLDAAARWLFRTTGQGTDLTDQLEGKIRTIFGEAGFRVEFIHIEIRQSTVMTVVAEKSTEK
jgi:ubiquinone/menaquinone biosynthesis C-methylase UbiE